MMQTDMGMLMSRLRSAGSVSKAELAAVLYRDAAYPCLHLRRLIAKIGGAESERLGKAHAEIDMQGFENILIAYQNGN